jgi:heavy metal translocating P-type ATPase
MMESRHDVLIVDGMFCAACAASVEATLARHPGIERVSVNFAADAAVIEWAPDAALRERIVETVRSLGYSARFVGDERQAAADRADPARDLLMRLIVALFFGMWTMLPSIALYGGTVDDAGTRFALALAAGVLSLPVVAYSGLPFYRMGIATLRAGVAGIDALITLGVAGSVVLSVLSLARGGGEVYFEVAVALVTLQLVARLIETRTRRRARDAVLRMLELAPTEVRLVDEADRTRTVPLSEVTVGARARLRPGERVAVDGTVVSGRAHLDRSLLTGQSEAVAVQQGDAVFAGERVLDGALTLEVTAAAGGRRVDLLARQVRQLLAGKPHWQRMADRVARHFLWWSMAAAAIGAVLALASGAPAAEAGVRALAVFVIACPCALSLAAPLAGLSATAAAARRGVVLRDLNALTSAAEPDVVFMDKTGTLTQGSPRVVNVNPAAGETRESVLRLAASAERDAAHPIARAIVEAARLEGAAGDRNGQGTLSVHPGHGISWTDGSKRIVIGRLSSLAADCAGIPALPPTDATRVGVVCDGRYVGAISMEDPLRPDAETVVAGLRARGMQPVMLSGDDAGPVSAISRRLGIVAHAALSPEQKLDHVERQRRAGSTVAFVGDGVNDGPALAAADVGIAVGGATDVAAAASAVAFVEADIGTLPALFDLTRRTGQVIRQNIAWAIVYNTIAIPAAMLGWVHPAVAAVAMALSSLSIAANAARVGDMRRAPVSPGVSAQAA